MASRQAGAGRRTRVLIVPARDEGDEIAALMLARLLNRNQYRIDAIPHLPLSQMLREISDRGPGIVCISALPPLSIGTARMLYRKVRGQIPKARIVVGMWRLAETVPDGHERVDYPSLTRMWPRSPIAYIKSMSSAIVQPKENSFQSSTPLRS
jgi:hypothetical protein